VKKKRGARVGLFALQPLPIFRPIESKPHFETKLRKKERERKKKPTLSSYPFVLSVGCVKEKIEKEEERERSVCPRPATYAVYEEKRYMVPGLARRPITVTACGSEGKEKKGKERKAAAAGAPHIPTNHSPSERCQESKRGKKEKDGKGPVHT